MARTYAEANDLLLQRITQLEADLRHTDVLFNNVLRSNRVKDRYIRELREEFRKATGAEAPAPRETEPAIQRGHDQAHQPRWTDRAHTPRPAA